MPLYDLLNLLCWAAVTIGKALRDLRFFFGFFLQAEMVRVCALTHTEETQLKIPEEGKRTIKDPEG